MPGVLDGLTPSLQSAGFVAGAGPGRRRAATPAAAATLAPGDAIGVALLSGDFALGATGTVTDVDGDRVYAFGHPLYNLGPTAFPMTRADVHAVLPSLVTLEQAGQPRRGRRHRVAGSRHRDRRPARPGAQPRSRST